MAGPDLAEIAERYPAEYAALAAGGDPSPGCDVETLDDLGKRVGAALQDAADAPPGRHDRRGHPRRRRPAGHRTPARLADAMCCAPSGALENCHWTELRHDRRRGWQLWAHNVGAPPLV